MGEIIRISNPRTVLAFLVVCSCGSATAYGQVLDFLLDLNTPASHAQNTPESASLDVDAEIGFSLSYFSRSQFDDGWRSRWGIMVGRQGLGVAPVGAVGSSVSHTALNVQAGGDWRVVGSPRLNLSAGVVGGLSFMSNSAPCSEVFCNLPESVVLLSPNLKAAMRLSSRVSGILETRGSVYMTDSDATFPFRSGVIFAVGLEVRSSPRKKE